MGKRIHGLLCSVLLLGSLAACGPHNGVEVGNPNLKGKSVTLTDPLTSQTFVVTFGPANVAAITQIIQNIYDTVDTPFALMEELLSLSATFSDGTQISIAMTLGANGEVLSVTLVVNGDISNPPFTAEEPELVCTTPSLNAATQLVTGLCDRIVGCNTVFECEDCETNILVVPGLAAQFGGPSETLQESKIKIDNGQKDINQGALTECLADISIIPCAQIQTFFNDTSAPNYNQIKPLVPKPSCANGVLKDK